MRHGDIRIGDRVRFDAKVQPIEIGCVSGASLTIGDNTYINYGTSIAAAERVTIGKDCLIGTYVMIVDNDFHRLEPDRRLERPDTAPTTLEDNVWVGGHSLVLKGVTIGENSVVRRRQRRHEGRSSQRRVRRQPGEAPARPLSEPGTNLDGVSLCSS